jgi:hypothetical protein
VARYRVRGITGATAATIDHAIFAVWNPSATKRIYLVEFGYVATVAPATTSGLYLRRITVRGTAGSTATPAAPNSEEIDAVPDSGFLLDLASYSVQPTLAAAPGMWLGWNLAAVIGSGIVYPIAGRGIAIPPGTGIAALNHTAVIVPPGEVGVVVDD